MSHAAYLASTAAAFCGWLGLAVAMDRHRADALPHARTAPRPALQRTAAWLLLGTAAALAIVVEGWSFGPLLALASLTVSACAVVLLLAWWPRRAPAAGQVGLGVLSLSTLAWWTFGH